MLTFGDVLEALCGVRPEWADQVITEASVDSRQVIPGSLFVAMPGERTNGHAFIQEAFKRGAVMAIIQEDVAEDISVIDLRDPGAAQERLLQKKTPVRIPVCVRVEHSLTALQQVARFWRRTLNLKVIGITGSVGKSTTKELVAEVLNQRYNTLKNPGNLNNEIGLPLTLLSVSEGYTRAVLEMGFYVPGEIAMLCELALPQIGVVTNIGTVHAERAGSIEAIVRGKTELVQALPPAPEGVAVLNYDDPLVRSMAEKTQARVFYYGMDPQADLWADQVESLGLRGVHFQLHYQGETVHMRVPMIGRHSVHTALRATAVGLLDGLSWQEIVNGLRASASHLRLVAVRTERGALVLDDTYNASPESTLAALNLLSELDGRKVAVFGDMLELGPYEREGHEMVGKRAAQVVDQLICVGSRAQIIADEAVQAGLPASAILRFADCQQAIEYLVPRLEERDVVLIKGSHGMRMDRIVSALEAQV